MGSTLCCLPLAPSVQCCLDREHLRGNPPGALIGVWLRGAAANIDSGGSGGAGTHTHTDPRLRRPFGHCREGAQPVNSRSSHGQLTVNSRSTQRSTHGQLNGQLSCPRDGSALDLHYEFVNRWSSGLTENSLNQIKIVLVELGLPYLLFDGP